MGEQFSLENPSDTWIDHHVVRGRDGLRCFGVNFRLVLTVWDASIVDVISKQDRFDTGYVKEIP